MNKYTLLDILQKDIVLESSEGNKAIAFEKVEIPMIQRDYAQGRIGEKEIRSRFLNAIFSSLINDNQESLEMDFIYGSFWEAAEKDSNRFIPLDGQQRLTTLFLLYWYVGLFELDKKEWNLVCSSLRKFTYETRTSSRRFCENIVSNVTKDEIFECTQDKESKKLSERIKNLSWFYYSYEKDPTIKAMLNMLDDIDEHYKQLNTTIWGSLHKLQFYILPLNGFGLSEELYIKMNARGKQLTDFENFKADFVNWLKDVKNPYVDIFQKEVKNDGRTMPYYLSFSQKLDNAWSNYFWNITKNYDLIAKDKNGKLINPQGKLIDPLFLSAIYRYFCNKYILYSETEASSIDKDVSFNILMREDKYQNFTVFKELLDKDANITTDFEKFFDALAQNWETIKDEIKPAWNKREWTFYNSGITQPDRVIFLAISSYLESNDYSTQSFKEWMRIVWNIVENTDIADVRSMIGVMRLIQELSVCSSKIYYSLADENYTIESSSSKIAVLEEREKASFIISNIEWEKAFIEAESHPFFKGAVSFLITDNMSIQEFIHRYDSASKVFTNNGVNEEFRGEGHIFLRALISRFNNKSIIGNNFTDQDEGEHYLKRLLASNETIRSATREWFSLPFDELKDKLKQEIEKESQIPGWSKNNEWEKIRIKRAHEALYKYPELQNWMQENSAIRFSWASGHLYISRPRSWYDWVQLESIRNEVIHQLINQGFKTDAENISGTSFYKGGNNIELYGEINGTGLKILFDYLNKVTIDKKISENEWLNIAEYNYVQEDKKLLNILSTEKLKELINK
ncbi:MAG: hypothetical protein PWQ06_1240 [Anaerophaga sp.]|nr:hypothetical protein [Anaerophaga sp.]